MTKKKSASTLIVAILAGVALVAGGLTYFAQTGQTTPTSTTGGATMSDQKPGADRRTGN